MGLTDGCSSCSCFFLFTPAPYVPRSGIEMALRLCLAKNRAPPLARRASLRARIPAGAATWLVASHRFAVGSDVVAELLN